jgi:transketolase N-terminal domain/subunit
VVGLIAPLRPPAGARARRLRLLALADQGKEAAEPLVLEDGRLSEGSAIFARQTTLGAKINNISLIVRDSNRLQLVGAVKSLPPFPPFRGRLVMLSGFVLP